MKSATKAEVGHKGVFGLVVDVLRGADLLYSARVHHHHCVGHGQGLLLVVGDVDKGDAQGLLDALQFILHVLAQLQVQSAQGLVQQQDLGPVYQGPGDGHPLLLSAGELGDPALFKALQVDHLEHLHDPVVDLLLGQLDLLFGLRVHLGDAQTEGDILKHVEVGEQGVPLKHSIYRPFVGRNRVNPHAVKKNIPGGGLLKTAYNTKRGGFAAPTGTQQREEFLVVDI